MSTRTLARLALALVVLVAVAAACQPAFPEVPHTTYVEDAGPIQVIAWGYCDRAYGMEIQITNQETGNIPITVQHDTAGDGTPDYTAELVHIAPGATRHWSWPGSWPARLIVRIGGPTGLIVMDHTMSFSCAP